ncbi:hypothetical protein [uncultured Cellulomonas sp.]|uniref:hypothetical protein n=1 Tax=uncultured Cellulomonas sp. TaxID=189682 RepID=UPI0028E73B35|nr:hypothetical protein [uncultured Cellulomonas sp.]
MRDAKLDRAAFGCVDNRAKLEVAFISNEAPCALFIAARGSGGLAVECRYRVHPNLELEG